MQTYFVAASLEAPLHITNGSHVTTENIRSSSINSHKPILRLVGPTQSSLY